MRAQRAHLDSLLAQLDSARARLKAYDDSVRGALARFDTVNIGSLRLVVAPSMRPRAVAAAQVVNPRLDSLAGAAAGMAARQAILVTDLRGQIPGADPSAGTDSMMVAVLSPRGLRSYHHWGFANDSTLAAWIYSNATRIIALEADAGLRRWSYGVLAADTMTTESWLGLRLSVVSSSASVSRACYEADIDACAVALGLRPVSDPLTQWYDAAGRRELTRRIVDGRRERFAASAANDAARCLEGIDAGCSAFLTADGRSLPDPISTYRRSSVTSVALQLGGARAYERLLLTAGTPADRLSAAAGVPLDSVLRVWQSRMRYTRRPSQDISLGIAAGSLLWIVAFGTLSLRSTRWR